MTESNPRSLKRFGSIFCRFSGVLVVSSGRVAGEKIKLKLKLAIICPFPVGKE